MRERKKKRKEGDSLLIGHEDVSRKEEGDNVTIKVVAYERGSFGEATGHVTWGGAAL